MKLLHDNARPAELDGMTRFAIVRDKRLGLSVPAMRSIAKTLGREHALALALRETGIPDARIVSGMVAEPAKLTSREMDAWVKDFASWDACDQVCGSAFLASPRAWRKVSVWAARPSCRAPQAWPARQTLRAFSAYSRHLLRGCDETRLPEPDE